MPPPSSLLILDDFFEPSLLITISLQLLLLPTLEPPALVVVVTVTVGVAEVLAVVRRFFPENNFLSLVYLNGPRFVLGFDALTIAVAAAPAVEVVVEAVSLYGVEKSMN